MPKQNQPWMPLYIGDYIKNTKMLPLNVRGAWIELMLAMWDNNPRGEIVGTMMELASLMSCQLEEAVVVIEWLKRKNICDYEDAGDGHHKIISRRMKKDMLRAETNAENGKKGGNPTLKKKKTPAKPHKRRSEDDSDIENDNTSVRKASEIFDDFRVMFGGTKNGNEIEFENFQRHEDWKEALPKLLDAVKTEIKWRAEGRTAGIFIPNWKNLKTWINNRCWEQTLAPHAGNPSTAPKAPGGKRYPDRWSIEAERDCKTTEELKGLWAHLRARGLAPRYTEDGRKTCIGWFPVEEKKANAEL